MSKRHRAVTFLGVLLAISLAVHFLTAWAVFAADQATHGGDFVWWGSDGFLVEWTRQLFENIVSEYLQLLTAAAIGAGLLSWMGVVDYQKDMEEVKRRLSLIEDELVGLGFQENDVAAKVVAQLREAWNRPKT